MTKIQWTDHTLNPLVGCTHASAGCKNCYAESASRTGRLQQFSQYHGVVDERGHWTGKINFVPGQLEKLLKFFKPTKIFMPSMSDPFHSTVKDEWLDQIFASIALSPQVTVQMLTKRPERMMEYLKTAKNRIRITAVDIGRLKDIEHAAIESCQWNWPLQNLWLGVSVENQAAADDRIPLLLRTPAAVRFLSVEPMLEAINLSCLHVEGITNLDSLRGAMA
jgi:protein gp37